MTRKQARETAFKLIFERVSLGEYNTYSLDLFAPNDNPQSEYIRNAYISIDKNLDSFLDKISAAAKKFKIDRIFKVDLALMLLAIYEIGFVDDVPELVAINEAVELSKIYSSDKSYSYIHGILSTFIKPKMEKRSDAGKVN